jgi:putative endonuclease
VNHNQTLGRYGETLAARCLVDLGLTVLDTNWRCARGEIDIIARDQTTLVFCEVKTRSSTAYGRPAEAVPGLKAARLRSLASQWLADHPGHWAAVRFDVVSVLVQGSGPARIEHLRGAF